MTPPGGGLSDRRSWGWSPPGEGRRPRVRPQNWVNGHSGVLHIDAVGNLLSAPEREKCYTGHVTYAPCVRLGSPAIAERALN